MKYQNICLAITNLANRGGEERMCVTLANSLAEYGYNVIIVSTDKPNEQEVQFAVSSKIKCYTLKGNRIERKLSNMSITRQYPLLKYKAILKRHHIQVVIDVDVHVSLITTKAVKKENVRIISWDHFNYERFLSWPTRQTLHDCFLNKINKLVVLTKSDLSDYIEKGGIPSSLVTQIYNPSPIEADQEVVHTNKKVLAIGRFVDQKGFDLLVDVWAKVEKVKTDWMLEIVGDGCRKDAIIDKIKSLNLKNITISPFTQDIRKKYADASIYVLSSRYEGFALVLLEALSMSLPVVAFNCPKGPEELIEEGVNGYLVPPLDIPALAEKLLLLMNDEQARTLMGKNAFQISQKFKMKSILPQWIELLESV